MLDPTQSRARQKRLLAKMAELKRDAVVIGTPHHVYYFTAFFQSWHHQAAFVLFADGRSWLACADGSAKNAAADEIAAYEANWHATLRQEQPAVVGELVTKLLKERKAKRVGFDACSVTSQVHVEGESKPIDPVLWQMRRVKDADEVKILQHAIHACEAMYARAKEIIEPGISELEVFNQLTTAAVDSLGEPMTALLGNDFCCGAGGGTPGKNKLAKDGEIYILDLGPAYRGYFSDNCRAFAVNHKPTDPQMKAWTQLSDALKLVEKMARPGVKCKDLYSAVDQHLKDARGVGMVHHLGHGIGLEPHEYPHLNPRWDDVLMEGEVFTAEPGIYAPEIAAGIRLENNYLVTSNGVRNMLNFPLELV